MTNKERANLTANQIAKVLDKHQVKPPLNFQAWKEIEALLEASFAEHAT